jgi:MatE
MSDQGDDSGGGGGFADYQEKTMDPGSAMLIATLLFSILITLSLPCWVALGRRFRNSHSQQQPRSDDHRSTDGDTSAAAPLSQLQQVTGRGSKGRRNSRNNTTTKKKKRETTDTTQLQSPQNNRSRPTLFPAAAARNNNEDATRRDDDDASSFESARTSVSATSAASALVRAILDAAPHGGPRATSQAMALRQRNDQMETSDDRSDRHKNGNTTIEATHGYSSEDDDDDDDDHMDRSVLGPLSHDEVSIRDAVDAALPAARVERDAGTAFTAGTGDAATSWRGRVVKAFDRLLVIAEWDFESRRICKLGLPFVGQALLLGVTEAIRVALIGRLVGTRALSAYVLVDMVIGVTTEFLKGFQHACTTLCSQAVGAGNRTLAGQYIQIATIAYTVCYIPIFIFWMLLIGDTISWFGFDDETRKIGEEYTMLFLFARFLHGVGDSLHSLLDVIGFENYSTFFIFGQEMISLAMIAVVATRPNTTTLRLIGLVYIAKEALGLVVNTAIIVCNGWFDRYLEGLVGKLGILVSGLFKIRACNLFRIFISY